MSIRFDPGYGAEPFSSLCSDYPGADVYPPDDFRVEWGPIFHRGRLDGSARVLVVGQDPAASEAIARRILVGAAGQRTQGFLARLGIVKSYVLVNTFLYSVYGQQGGARHKDDPAIAAYRERWFTALLGPNVEAVLALGSLADRAWQRWAKRVGGRAASIPYQAVPHPTWPESSSGGDAAKLTSATATLLQKWNAALVPLRPAILHPDVPIPTAGYGNTWKAGDLVPIPPEDLPAGLPEWMRSLSPWATRSGKTAAEKRATVVVTVPASALTRAPVRPETAQPFARAARSVAEDLDGDVLDTTAAGAVAASVHSAVTQGLAPTRLLASKRYALRGRVVTMAKPKVIADGVVWVVDGVIAAVQPATAAAPDGFRGIAPVETNGSIYPGFMDLHNHLAYNVLPLWNVPRTYSNRDKWKSEPTYDQLVKRPLSTLRTLPSMLPAICRYVECKSLFGGVTTTEGIRLANAGAISSYFRGFVRNVEMPEDGRLPRAESRMPDVAANDVNAFFQTIQTYNTRSAAYLLHLSEGDDPAARKHFLALQLKNGSWAIDRALAGIHCVALTPGDFGTLAENEGSMIWSPMSNLLLYGRTADVSAAKEAKVRIALGCDWSPSGSKNLLAELKVAWLHSKANHDVFSAEEIVQMVTTKAAEILRWDDTIGRVEAGKIADLTVLSSREKDPFENVIRATEADVRLVVIGGIPRYGYPDLMAELVTRDKDVEDVSVAGQLRSIDLETTDPRVPTIRFAQAQGMLSDALQHLPDLALQKSTHLTRFLAARSAVVEPGWTIALDETEPTGLAMRPAFGTPAVRVATSPAKTPSPLPTIPLQLDAPSIEDHGGYWEVIARERNLPEYVKQGMPLLYGPSTTLTKRRTATVARR